MKHRNRQQAKNDKPKPIEIKEGNVRVRIYQTVNRGRPLFQLADHTSGKRKLRTFSELKEARAEARRIAVQLARGEIEALELTGRDRAVYQRAAEALDGAVALDVAAMRYKEAVEILGEDLVVEAAKFYAKRHPQRLPDKSVTEVYHELLEDTEQRGLSERYVQTLRYVLGNFAEAFQVPVASVGSAEIRVFLKRLKLSPRSHNNFLNGIHRFFEFAKKRKYLPRDWDEVGDVERVKDVGGEIMIWTPEELARVLKAAPDDIRIPIAISAFSGLRSAEVERLDWSEINLQQGFIRVTAGKAKTASRRLAPIPANLAAWLAPVSLNNGAVWTGSHARFYDAQQEAAAGTGDKDSKPLEWKANALRHSFISYRTAELQDVNRVALECGNSPRVIFSNYRELVTPEESKQWFSIMPGERSNVISIKKVA